MTAVGSLQGDWGYTYVHNTTIDVSKLLQSEQPCAMSGVIEYEALQVLLAGF
jgi:hypothetical protein